MPDKPNNEDLRRRGQNYMKYSGMAIQMGIIILIGVFGGKKLDAYLETDPIFTVILALISIFAALYVTLKDLL
ncbi:MAG: AtpZ/AtpI family protein [Lewinella sp.]|nr:AtpZ/AtpI family protein [Lewinella sp.]